MSAGVKLIFWWHSKKIIFNEFIELGQFLIEKDIQRENNYFSLEMNSTDDLLVGR